MFKFICLFVCLVLNLTTVSAAYTYPPPTPPRQTPPPQNNMYLPPKTSSTTTTTPQPPPNTYLPPTSENHPTPVTPQIDDHQNQGIGDENEYIDEHEHAPGMPFDFNYSVNDVETSNIHNHQASSDGDVTRGEYRVLLPDGRTQVVRYTADWKNGYNAEVTYE